MSRDPRLDALQAWLVDCGALPTGPLEAASGDASFRRYFRVPTSAGSRIAMDAPPDREPLRPFVDVHGRLARAGLNVPDILAQDLEQGFLLLSDLGREGYLEQLAGPRGEALMDSAVDALVHMQRCTDPAGLPVYDAERLGAELDLFPTWYVEAHLGVTPDRRWSDAWARARAYLVERALAQPRVFVHRDYMPRNLMVCEPAPGILDFQDAVTGPMTYDLASLLRDAFHSWPEDAEARWIARYHEAARAAGLPVEPDRAALVSDLWAMAAQRHLKVLGIFARLRHRDGKPRYLADAPRFHRYLRAEIGADPNLAALGTLLDDLPDGPDG